jgi:hypothetical protein
MRIERSTRIEPDGTGGHERIRAEAWILGRIFDHEQALFEDRVRAESDIARGLLYVHAYPCFEPLAIRIDEGDQCHRRFADLRSDQREIVEGLLRHGIEDLVIPERR